MHCDLLADGFVATFHCDENTDLAHACGCSIVDIGHNVGAFDRRHATDGHVFADGGDFVGDGCFDGLAAQVSRFQRVNVVNRQSCFCNAGHHFLEVRVFRNEVGFGVHFNSNTFAAFDDNCDQTFSRGTAGFLGCFCETLGAQPVNSGFHVAVVFDQCFFRVHHACAGGFAQFFHHCCSDCHLRLSSSQIRFGAGLPCPTCQIDDTKIRRRLQPQQPLLPALLPEHPGQRLQHPAGRSCRPERRERPDHSTARLRVPRRRCRG